MYFHLKIAKMRPEPKQHTTEKCQQHKPQLLTDNDSYRGAHKTILGRETIYAPASFTFSMFIWKIAALKRKTF